MTFTITQGQFHFHALKGKKHLRETEVYNILLHCRRKQVCGIFFKQVYLIRSLLQHRNSVTGVTVPDFNVLYFIDSIEIDRHSTFLV